MNASRQLLNRGSDLNQNFEHSRVGPRTDLLSTVLVQRTRSSSFFTALHEMQTRSSDENSVCLSVGLSDVCHTREL